MRGIFKILFILFNIFMCGLFGWFRFTGQGLGRGGHGEISASPEGALLIIFVLWVIGAGILGFPLFLLSMKSKEK